MRYGFDVKFGGNFVNFTYVVRDIKTANRLQNAAQNNQLELHFERFLSITHAHFH